MIEKKAMKTKELVSLIIAIVLVLSGIVLSFLSFFLSQNHVIAESILWYFAQTLLYAGSVFGFKNYVDYKLGCSQSARTHSDRASPRQ